MAHSTTRDELLELAFELAYFIHGDERLALRIAMAGLEKLDAADSTQDKRRYYNPSGQRRRVSMPELQLLQRLVYAESEKQERFKEQAGTSTPSQTIMVKRFIKHLAKITCRRNSLHVTLGISRLLYDYSTAETAEVYRLVSQAPDRVPEDAYWRSRKAILMGELKERFGARLTVERGPRNQERFRTQRISQRLVLLVQECLEHFTPWHTTCRLPGSFDPITDELDALSFRGQNPDEEHKIELNRYHALLHPPCFEQLALALGYDTPSSRLAIPQFMLSAPNDNNDDEDESGGASPPKLSDDDRAAVRSHLNRQSGRRLASTAGLLLFVLDDEVLAKLDPGQRGEVSFAIPRSAEFIEIRSLDREGEVLIAVHPLEFNPDGDLAEQQVEFELAVGRGFRLIVTPAHNAESETSGGRSAAGTSALFSDARPERPRSGATVRAISLAVKPARSTSAWAFGGWLKPAIAFAALAIVAAGLVYVLIGRQTSKQPIITQSSPTPAPTASPLLAEQSPTPAPTPVATPLPATERVLAVNLPADPLSKLENLTRGQREEEAVTSLLAAKKLYVEGKGAPALAEPFAEAIKQRLQAGGNFNFTGDSTEAEIALKLIVESKGQRLRVTARIVNVKGEVLWPLTPGIRARRYDGVSEEVIAELSRELLRDIQQLKQK
ncbi:MAG: hypothetical protein M3X11_10205 [Acidobacteriota bacterium]|nr:hypothetical protein [Acidobacteriota bacterium]